MSSQHPGALAEARTGMKEGLFTWGTCSAELAKVLGLFLLGCVCDGVREGEA